jgi:TM2 domain-containing membrane protein YozV
VRRAPALALDALYGRVQLARNQLPTPAIDRKTSPRQRCPRVASRECFYSERAPINRQQKPMAAARKTEPEPQYWHEREGEVRGPYSFEILVVMWGRGELRITDRLCKHGQEQWLEVSRIMKSLERAAQSQAPSDRSRGVYIILGLFLGVLGIHNFYAGRYLAGTLQCVLFVGLWWTVIVPIGLFLWVVMELVVRRTDGKGRAFR